MDYRLSAPDILGNVQARNRNNWTKILVVLPTGFHRDGVAVRIERSAYIQLGLL